MNGKDICGKIAKELSNKFRSRDTIVATTINEETLRDLSCKTIYEDCISAGSTDSYCELFVQEVPYSCISSSKTQQIFRNIKGAKLDTYFKERSHICAIEFKCNTGDNMALPKRAGLIFNDLFRLYQIDTSPFEERYLIYLTDYQVETYAYKNGAKKKGVFPLEVILDEWFMDKEILVTSDDINKYSPCDSFAGASFKSFDVSNQKLETVVRMVAHETINKYDLYIIEVRQNPHGDYAETHKPIKISETEECFKKVDIEDDDQDVWVE